MSNDPINVLDECRARLEACLETFEQRVATGEPVADADLKAIKSVCDPTLAKCNALLADFERQKLDAMSPMRISAYFDYGNFSDPVPKDFGELYAAAGNLLDDCESHDILGRVVFLAENQKWYGLTVEAVVTELDKSYVDELRMEENVVALPDA